VTCGIFVTCSCGRRFQYGLKTSKALAGRRFDVARHDRLLRSQSASDEGRPVCPEVGEVCVPPEAAEWLRADTRV
jgi:hypothetical protein